MYYNVKPEISHWHTYVDPSLSAFPWVTITAPIFLGMKRQALYISRDFLPFFFANPFKLGLQLKHPNSMMLPPPGFTVGVILGAVPASLQIKHLELRSNCSISAPWDQRILFLMCCALRRSFCLATLPKSPGQWRAAVMAVFLSPHRISCSVNDHWSFGRFSDALTHLGLGKVNFFHVRIRKVTVLAFFRAFPDNPVSELCCQVLWPHGFDFTPFQIMSYQFHLSQVDSNQAVEVSQQW